MPIVMEAFRSSEMAVTAKRVSLPALVWMLWSRVRFINDEFYKTSGNRIEVSVSTTTENKSNQTEETCLVSCENCQLTKETVTKLVDKVEAICINLHMKTSQVTEVRKQMTNDVFLLSQWGAMTKWCEALTTDIEFIGNLSLQTYHQNKKCISKLKRVKQELTGNQNSLQKVEEEKTKLRADIDKAHGVKSSYVKKISEISTKLKTKIIQCEDLQKQFTTTEELVITLKKELADSKHNSIKEKEKAIELSHELNSKCQELEKLQEDVKLKTESVINQTYELKDQIDTKEFTINSLNEKLQQFQIELEETKIRENSLKLEILKEQNHGAVIWRNYEALKETNKKQEKILEEKTNQEQALLKEIEELKMCLAEPQTKKGIELTGDPVQDMEKQKKVNEEQIKRLSEHNLRIKKTLSKLYSQSTPSLTNK